MNIILLFFIGLLVLPVIQPFFLNLKFGNKIDIKEREYKQQITYRLPPHKQQIINKINGFYGLIGPDVNISSVTNLFDLFIGDGNIQGVFFENGNITLIKHFVRTDKLKYEEVNGKIPNNNFIKLIFSVFNTVKLLPDIMGLANTALLNIQNKVYALYERDQPYLVNINFENKEITTVKKQSIQNIHHISGHTKYMNNMVETIDYDVASNQVMYYQLTDKFQTIFRRNLKTKYMPVVHDFWSAHDKIVFIDSPLFMDMKNLFTKTLPVLLDKKRPTCIHVFNKNTNIVDTYSTEDSFYMFHFADLVETDDTIYIYGSLYDELDFSDLNIKGNYREMILYKTNKTITINKIPELERFDLDFPIKFDDKIVFRNIKNKSINGFVIFHKMNMIKEIIFEKLCICGEPALVMVENQPYIVAFAYSNTQNCILFVNLRNFQQIVVDVPFQLNIGFHSLFIPK